MKIESYSVKQPGSSLDPLVSRRGHKLLTTKTCKCDKRSDRECPVCDWGLGVCEWCGAAECELDERDCTGKPANGGAEAQPPTKL